MQGRHARRGSTLSFRQSVNSRVLKLSMVVMIVVAPVQADWLPLVNDGLHDPNSPGVEMLQEPAQALSELPPDTAGNKVQWNEALEQGDIVPRSQLYPETEIEILDQDIIFYETSDMPLVVFPHDKHTAWLDCSNCHDKIFPREAGATQFGMLEILSGRYCGRCHGAVSFPLTECNRCHSLSR